MASAKPQPSAVAVSADDVPALFVRHKTLLTFCIMGATLMQILDSTIANVALPHMQASLGGTQDSISWVLTSYIIASAIAIPITGWLSDRIGMRRLFTLSVITFVLASMLCGIASSLTEMVVYRLLQGISGAFITPLAQSVLLDINPRRGHPRAMAIYGLGIMIGPIMGPILGGWLTENFSWRWVFFVNVPVGLLCFVGLWRLLPKTPVTRRSFDLTGFAMLALGLGALQLMLDRGQHVDWFNSPEIWIESGVALCGFWMFGIHLYSAEKPLIPPSMLQDANFVAGLFFMFIVGLIAMSTMALLPVMMQGLFGYSVMGTGELLMSRGAGVAATMVLVGILGNRVDQRVWVTLGFSITACSLWMMTQWTLVMSWEQFVFAGIIQGVGLGLLFVPLTIISFATLPAAYRTEGASLVNLSRNMGASVGISVLTALLAQNIQISHADIANGVTQYSLPVDPAMIAPYGPAADQVMAMLNGEVNRQAAMIAYLDNFYLMMILTLCCIPMVLLLKAPKRAEDGDPLPVLSE